MEKLKSQLSENRNKWLQNMKDKEYMKVLEEITNICQEYIFNNNILPEYDLWDDLRPYNNDVAEKHGIKYINASFVDRFIACQEPKEEHLDIFYDFLEKSEIELIISLKDELTYFKNISSNLIKDNGLFRVEDYKLNNKTIRRINCYIWKDDDIITHKQMEELYKYIKKHPSFNDKHKTLIHCYAGVGRTGTMIMYSLLKELESVDEYIILETLLKLRMMRVQMVGSSEQMKFLIDAFVGEMNVNCY